MTPLPGKPIAVDFHSPDVSSLGGLSLTREKFKRTELPAKEYHRIAYKAGSRKHKRQVAIKLEIAALEELANTHFAGEIPLPCSMPGIKRFSALCILAETGNEMSRFQKATHLIGWPG